MITVSIDLQTFLKNAGEITSSLSNAPITLIIQPEVKPSSLKEEAENKHPDLIVPKIKPLGLMESYVNPDVVKINGFHDTIKNQFTTKFPSALDAATQLEMNVNSFKVLFKQLYAKPYYNYFLDLRLEQAKSLLESGKYKVCEISKMLGYSQTIKFNLVFKKKFGVSPGKFKKRRTRTK
jgi:AraC-like DNA-binding protein